MRYAGRLGGGTPTVIKYQAGETFAAPGIPAEVAGAAGYGLQQVETATAIKVIGLALDTATVVTAQQTGGASTTRLLSVVTNADAILRSRVSGGGTNNTAITAGTIAVATSDGLDTDADTTYDSPSIDQGCILYATGQNSGVARIITSLSSANAVHVLAFPHDSTTTDTVIGLPWGISGDLGSGYPCHQDQYVVLTGTWDQVDMSGATDTNNVNFVPLRLVPPADYGNVLTDLEIELLHYDHLYGGGQLV